MPLLVLEIQRGETRFGANTLMGEVLGLWPMRSFDMEENVKGWSWSMGRHRWRMEADTYSSQTTPIGQPQGRGRREYGGGEAEGSKTMAHEVGKCQ